jgi:hypothetical protein
MSKALAFFLSFFFLLYCGGIHVEKVIGILKTLPLFSTAFDMTFGEAHHV